MVFVGAPIRQQPTPITQDSEMENTLNEATQPLTQPYFDPRRLGRNNSDVSDHDACDVICILAPNSPLAYEAVLATMIAAPQHILQNEDLQGITTHDLLSPQFTPGNSSRDIALRISSQAKNPAAGFVFGRNKSRCDILLVDDEEDKSVSNMHFRIFLNSQGILMLQDTSTNGTIVDDNHLRCKDKHGVRYEKPPMRMIDNGTLIRVIGKEKAEIKFLVRNPKRGDYEGAFLSNLNKFISSRDKSQVSVSATSRQHTYGMHWHGGSRYNVVGHLGKGAFATVYRLATTLEGIPFAAKELDKRRFIKNGVLDLKFDNEIQIMKGLRHPNIVQYVDFHDHEQWLYIIMEYMPHGELSGYMRERGPIPEEQARIITRQILRALDYLHRRNITHRDIKPDNILIASFEPLVVKLGDFGLSKCVNDEETFLKTFCGTLLYCAPEVYPEYATYQQGENRKRRRVGEPSRRASPYDQSVDMWSFGAVLFHIMCGKAPIIGRGDDKGTAQMLNNIMTKDVNFFPLRDAGVSEEAVDFISQLLNRNPLLRPNERDCLQHPWIRDVPDNIDYRDEEEVLYALNSGLEAVEEVEEDFLDDEEEGAYQAILGLAEVQTDIVDPADTDRLDPRFAAKRRRLSTAVLPITQPSDKADDAEVVYPKLPQTEPAVELSTTGSPHRTNPRADRLFGEITLSLLRSSGVLGQGAPPQADVPALLDGVEQISVNDFVTFNTADAPQRNEGNSELQLQRLRALPMPALPSSAPSLLGAEAQIGLLNMASPDNDGSEGTTPDTTNPLTPKTREMTPSESEPKSQPAQPVSADGANSSRPEITFSPLIDLEKLEDEVAHAASMRAREASRIRIREQKAKTFHANVGSAYRPAVAGLANPVDTQRENKTLPQAAVSAGNLTTLFERPPSPSPSPYSSTNSARDGFAKPLPRLGKLSTLPGSVTNTTIYLSGRMTSWGRDPRSRVGANIVHTDKKDVRVPKRALQITFWAPGIEERIERGEDWMMAPGICTIVSTSTSRCIWINDVELQAQSKEGDARLYGQIYTGDVVTIFKSPDAKEGFLKFRVEIGYGDSARKRPENEPGFQVKRETVHHQRGLGAKSMMAGEKESKSEPNLGRGLMGAAFSGN